MSIIKPSSRVAVLIKALPQPSKNYGETVCCAGVTANREWKRLYPVRFRHLSGDTAFARWDWVSFKYGKPKHDSRPESCHVHEDSIVIDGKLAEADRSKLLLPMLKVSGIAAAADGASLALIEPKNTKFFWRQKNKIEIEEEREAYRIAASQEGLFDKRLSEIDPTPYDFKFRFTDGSGQHEYRNGDWEAHATFWNHRQRTSEKEALNFLDHKFNEEYPKKGMVFAIGNMAKRPQVWQLLGVIRMDTSQPSLF